MLYYITNLVLNTFWLDKQYRHCITNKHYTVYLIHSTHIKLYENLLYAHRNRLMTTNYNILTLQRLYKG